EAHYWWVSERRRYASGSLALAPTAMGSSEGFLERSGSGCAPLEPCFLVLSSEADGRSPATVGYPYDGYTATFDAVDELLLDGGEAARAREERRSRRHNLSLLGYVAFVFGVTLVLFVRRLRAEGARA